MMERRWDDDRANQLLDAACVVLEAAGGWETPEDDQDDDPASLLRFIELYFSEGVRRKIWPYVDQMNSNCLLCQLGSSSFANSLAPFRTPSGAFCSSSSSS
jgi:hypothetical protein